MSITGDILRGHTEAIILFRLLETDSYGYEISKQIQQLTNGLVELKEATLYTAFRRLEESGQITSYWGEGGGARRRYYKITEKGKLSCLRYINEWEETRELLNKLLGGKA